MSRIGFSLFSTIVFFIFLAGCSAKYFSEQGLDIPQVKGGILAYNNSVYNFSINYHYEWEKIEDLYGAAVVFRSPLEDRSDTFLENINILVRDVSLSDKKISFEEFATKHIKRDIPESDILEFKLISLDGNPAYRIVYLEGRYKFLQVLSIKNDKIFLLTYGAEPDKYNKFLNEIEDMIVSFKFS